MKYSRFQSKVPPKPDPAQHPAWRGIGCILWVLDPLMSYALAFVTVGALSKNGMIPAGLLGNVQFPDWVAKTPTLSVIAGFISSLNNLWAMLIFFFIFVLILAGLFSTIYTIIYRYVGPPRYTIVDAPPTKHKAGKMSR